MYSVTRETLVPQTIKWKRRRTHEKEDLSGSYGGCHAVHGPASGHVGYGLGGGARIGDGQQREHLQRGTAGRLSVPPGRYGHPQLRDRLQQFQHGCQLLREGQPEQGGAERLQHAESGDREDRQRPAQGHQHQDYRRAGLPGLRRQGVARPDGGPALRAVLA